MVVVGGSAEHRPIDVAAALELRRNLHAVLLARDGGNDNNLLLQRAYDEEATVAASQQFDPRATATVNAVESHVEALRKDAVRRVQDRFEDDTIDSLLEETEEGRLPVVLKEAAVEPGVGDDASPALADGGGAWKGGGLRREAEEDLPKEIIVLKRRAAAAATTIAAGHCGCPLNRVDLWTEERAAPWSCSVALITRVNPGMEARAAAAGQSVAVVSGVDLGIGMEPRAAAAGHCLARLTRVGMWMEARARARATAAGVLGRAHLAAGGCGKTYPF